MCSLPEPRRRVESEGTQEAVQMARLSLSELHAGRRATARHGGAGGAQEVRKRVSQDGQSVMQVSNGGTCGL